MALTKPQRARLEKLATYLEGLPEDYAHFNMAILYNGNKEAEYACKNGGVKGCGTVACALGHGPAAGVLVPPRFIERRGVDWWGYADLFVTGDGQDWCFDSSWEEEDNTPHGAAARIRYLLDRGVPPARFDYPGDSDWPKLYAPYRIDAKAQADA